MDESIIREFIMSSAEKPTVNQSERKLNRLLKVISSNKSKTIAFALPIGVAIITYFCIIPTLGSNYEAYKYEVKDLINYTLIFGVPFSLLGSAIGAVEAIDDKFKNWKAWGAIFRYWGAVAAFGALYLTSLIFFET